MALLLIKELSIRQYIFQSRLFASAIRMIVFKSKFSREYIPCKTFEMPVVSYLCHTHYQILGSQEFSTSFQPEQLSWEGSSQSVLLKKIQIALKDRQLDEAWGSFFDFKRLYGFPEQTLVHRLITEFSYSSDPRWLRRACDLVLLISEQKSDILETDILTKLALSLARGQLPNPATMILRLMLEKQNLPSINVLRLILLHLVKTEIGIYLASNFVVQMCDYFMHLSTKKRSRAAMVKPDTFIFNLVLDACVRCKLSFKGQQIMELMPSIGVVADAHTIVLIARIHEMNGQRDEIKKYKPHINQVSAPLICHYCQFYDSLLSLHFKFNDINAAAELTLNLNRYQESLTIRRDRKELQKPRLVPIGSNNLKTGSKMLISPELLHKDSVLKVEGKQKLIIFRNGKLIVSNRTLAKLISGYKKIGNTSELSKLLLGLQNGMSMMRGSSLCFDVIDACIYLGWLEMAHDILDDMEAAGFPLGLPTYTSLLTAYCKLKLLREAKALLKQMRKAGFAMSLSEEIIVAACLPEVLDQSALSMFESTSTGKSVLAESLIQEMKEEERTAPFIYEVNSSIYYFCKAKMMGDALRTYRKMQETGVQPTEQTFIDMVEGYASMGMFRDITFLWGDIKRNMKCGNLVVSRDLYEYLLMNFIQGGYFERVMEIVDYMQERGMFPDKWMYKNEFLKFHKNLYRNLKGSEARTEAQGNRLRFVKAFKKWVGLTEVLRSRKSNNAGVGWSSQ